MGESLPTVMERQRLLVQKLSIIEDPQERLAALMSRAKKWPVPAAEALIETNRVHGCQSRVWLVPRMEENVCRFAMECDAPMVKGLVALMCELYDGSAPADVAAVEPSLFEELGFDRMISPTRLHGLAAVRAKIREFAAHVSKT
jgi:cysteine desulfuration protein SufE